MKINEFMIGDLVFIHESECKGHRIDYISEADGKVGADGELYNIDDIRPIPLSDEFFEKNEFKLRYGDSDYYEYHEWSKTICDKTIKIVIDNAGMFCCIDGHTVKKVEGLYHLQHIMNDIGIEFDFVL